MTFDRVGIGIGFLKIHYYGLIIMVGVIIAALISYKRAKDRGEDAEQIWDIVIWVLISGIIGARLWHLLTPPASMVEQGITFTYYLSHPLDAIATWNGGLGIPGAITGGALGLYLYTRKHKTSFLTWLDIIAPGLAVAQAIGRWGNFVNQELYGQPSTLPWAIFIEPAYRLPEYYNFETYHPLFLYECIWNLMVAGVLILLDRRLKNWLLKGDLFLFYLIGYPVGRFFLEFLRLDASKVGELNINQTLMATVAVCAVIGLFIKHHYKKEATPLKPEDKEPESNELTA